MLDLLIGVYIQFVIMLIELKKVLSVHTTLNANTLKQGMFVLHQDYHSPFGMNHMKKYECESLIFLLH